LFFFGGGEKRGGKSSFAVFGFGAGIADCKCAFSFAVVFVVQFVDKHGRMKNHIAIIEIINASI